MPPAGSRKLEHLYLGLAVLGFAVTGGYTLWQSARTGNWLFWTQPRRTLSELFANGTSTAFGLDLALVVVTTFVWMWHEARAHGIPAVWRFWLLTLLLGLAGPLPLFLFVRERRRRLAA
jgi:Terpene cyclase DEP1